MRVENLCRRDVVTIGVEGSLRDAALLMRANHVGDVVVVNDKGAPVGIVTDRDLVIEVLARDLEPERISVGDLVSGELETTRLDDEALSALETMCHRGVRRLPVVDRKGTLVGILSADELLEMLSVHLGRLAEMMRKGREREVELRE